MDWNLIELALDGQAYNINWDYLVIMLGADEAVSMQRANT